MKIIEKSYFLINRKTRWGLTIWGWFAIVFLIVIFLYLLGHNLYRILAPIQREKSEILVLEGAASDYVIDSAIREFKQGHYQLLITTGTPLEWGHLLASYDNTARLAAATLIKSGFDSTRLVIISTSEIRNDRTYNSANELKRWFALHKPDVKSINLMSLGVHSGRSRLLFQYALGDSIRVGIIAVGNFYYGANDWWKSGKGFRETLNEALGYFYARYFFRAY
jgi:hypothetical protein